MGKERAARTEERERKWVSEEVVIEKSADRWSPGGQRLQRSARRRWEE
jgi:hypothetical protein